MILLNGFTKLKLNKEFRRAYGRGKSFVHPAIVTYVFKTKTEECRIGITTSKKIGCAVERNRARRVITAAFRECLPRVETSCDIVFVARTRILKFKSTDIARIIGRQLEEAGVLKPDD